MSKNTVPDTEIKKIGEIFRYVKDGQVVGRMTVEHNGEARGVEWLLSDGQDFYAEMRVAVSVLAKELRHKSPQQL